MQQQKIKISQWMVDSLLGADARRAAVIICRFGDAYGQEYQEELIATILRQIHSAWRLWWGEPTTTGQVATCVT